MKKIQRKKKEVKKAGAAARDLITFLHIFRKKKRKNFSFTVLSEGIRLTFIQHKDNASRFEKGSSAKEVNSEVAVLFVQTTYGNGSLGQNHDVKAQT